MNPELESFYLNKSEPNKGCFLALRSLILQKDESVTETLKYGMPCFCYRKKMFCYLWMVQKTNLPYILFVEGKHLDHPDLHAGKRTRMKTLYIDSSQDLPIDTIQFLLDKALDLYRNGTIRVK